MEMDETRWLRERLERALGGRHLEDVLPAPRALVGLGAGAKASADVRLARRAVEKLRWGGTLLRAELELLEAGIRLARPASLVESGRLSRAPQLAMDGDMREAIESLLPGVASVRQHPDVLLATAFQVRRRVLVTSGHVARKLLCEREGLARGCFVASFPADPRTPGRVVILTRVLALHRAQDVALLELSSDGPLAQGLPLARAPDLVRGGSVLAVGFPLYSPYAPPLVELVFEQLYGVMRASPGELVGARGSRLYHDCTTLPGSSGSPLFDLRTGLVIGVHASGTFAVRNTAVATGALHALPALRALVATWG